MKRIIVRRMLLAVSLLALAALIMFSNEIARMGQRYQNSALQTRQPGTELFTPNYNNLMLNLYAASGR